MDPKRSAPNVSPPVKVVGFHVEGASPSPRPSTLNDLAGRGEVSTSPSPVIIPPLFQGQRDAGPASPLRAPSAPAGTFSPIVSEDEDGPGLRPIRTSSLSRDEPGARTPVKSPVSRGSTPRPLPVSPVQSAPAALLSSQDVGGAVAPPLASPRALATAATVSGTPTATSAATGGIGSPFTAQDQQELAQAASQQPPQPQQPPIQQQQQQQQPAKPKAQAPPAQQAQQQGAQPKAQRHVEPPPKKELTKAERRAIQEAQRAAKAAAKAGPQEGSAATPKLTKQGSASNLSKQTSGTASKLQAAASSAADSRQASGSDAQAKGSKQRVPAASGGGGSSKEEGHSTSSTDLFAHLPPYRKITLESIIEKGAAASVPFEAVKLGLQYVDGSIRGANARCAAMLAMFMHVIQEFKAPPGRGEVAKEVLGVINSIISFLVASRPLSVTMGNAIKYIKCELERLKLQPSLTEQQVKEDITDKISNYLQEKIRAADNLIVEHAIAKIQDGDVILTYSHSTLVAAVLLRAREEGRRFSVVVADARPQLEGRRLLRVLLAGGISCEYIYLNALSFSLDRVTKVLLGAGAVLSNGTVLSRVGSAAVAMMAAAERIPVLVCSETYKFHERVQLDSITQNELGDPELVAQLPDWMGTSPLAGWRDTERLGLLNLKYDAMPADFVSVVVTEAGLIPPTSVAVILRESRQDVMV